MGEEGDGKGRERGKELGNVGMWESWWVYLDPTGRNRERP